MTITVLEVMTTTVFIAGTMADGCDNMRMSTVWMMMHIVFLLLMWMIGGSSGDAARLGMP